MAPVSNVYELIRRVPLLESTDTVRRAAGLLRESAASRLFVQHDGQVFGVVTERSIVDVLARESGDGVLDRPIEPLVESSVQVLNSSLTLQQAAGVFAETGEDVLPVVDNFGSFYGVLFRRDVTGALTSNLRPPTVGGMATPLGVFLTTGSVTGGAGSYGLFLTGVSLGLMMAIARLAVYGIQQLVTTLTGFPVTAYVASPPIMAHLNIYDLPRYLSTLATTAIFLLLMRLSPLSGYHAAEHMTVHAIEHGEVLYPDHVRAMPRVHPRCGTNLLAAVGVFLIVVSSLGSEIAVLLALVVVLLWWRVIGGWLQYFVTTKTPTDRQLESGLAAGRQVLERFQERPGYQATGFQRIWNLGFLQTAAGMVASVQVAVFAFGLFGLSIP